MKQRYEKPQIVYREKIEARAGSCTKAGVGPPDCTAGTLVS